MIKDFIQGVLNYFEAIRLVSRLSLGRYFLYSGMIGLTIFFVMFVVVKSSYDSLSKVLDGVIPWDVSFMSTLTDILSVGFISVVFFIIFKHLVLIFTAPVMSILSEKVELEMANSNLDPYRNKSVIRELARGLRISTRNLIRELSITVFLFILGLFPVFAIGVGPLVFLVQSYYAGFGNYDFWAERHFDYRGTLDYMSGHKSKVTANGLIFLLMLSIPILGVIIAPPLATIAATVHGSEDIEPRDYLV